MAKKPHPNPNNERIDLTKSQSAKKDDPKTGLARFSRGPNPFVILLLVAIVVSSLYAFFSSNDREIVNTDIGINEVVKNYREWAYSNILVEGRTITAERTDQKEQWINGELVTTTQLDRVKLPTGDGLSDIGLNDPDNPTSINVKDDVWGNLLLELVPTVIMMVLFVLLLVFLIGRLSSGVSGGPMALLKNRARIYDPEGKDRVKFSDVAGADEEKDDLTEVVDFLKHPKKYEKLGAKIPRGILMVWPPGTGKTLLARAVAGESDVPFFSISGSEFMEVFVGVGAARVRDLFREAKEKAPAIIFIDEIDAIGKRRSPSIGGGHDEREQTLNQILTEMDGFDNETHVIILAATNRADVLDKALLRPGRFDRKVTINLPNIEDRVKILEVHAKGKPLAKNVQLRSIASSTVGFSGADLANLINEAAILAGKKGNKTITQAHLQQSIEKVLMGNTKKSLKMTELEARITAYHEVGHAIVGKMLPHTDPVHKVSILSRGRALGVTWFLPERDSILISKAKFLDELATLFGGRVAEEIFFGQENITTGASNDIERATEIARNMVMRYGFDEELGPENLSVRSLDGNHLGMDGDALPISEETHKIVDSKVRSLLKSAYDRAKSIISENQDLHERIVQVLLKKEEILREEFDAFFDGHIGLPAKAVV